MFYMIHIYIILQINKQIRLHNLVGKRPMNFPTAEEKEIEGIHTPIHPYQQHNIDRRTLPLQYIYYTIIDSL